MVATKYDLAFNDLAFNIMKVYGSTDKQLAEFLGVSDTTLYDWKVRHPAFAQAVHDGKDYFDTHCVKNALLERALGYSHETVDIKVVNGEIVETPVIKHYPPDTTAATFWLKNRDRSNWKDKQDVEMTGVQTVVNMTVDDYKNARREMLEKDDC